MTRGEQISPACEIHVPISPTPGFFSRVHLLAASVRRYGGRLADAKLHVTVSRDGPWIDVPSAYPWANHYPIEWHWMPQDVFEAHDIWGTADYRFTHDFDAEFVLMLDADTLCTAPLDELIELGQGAVGGLVDYDAPKDTTWPSDTGFWHRLYAALGLGEPELSCDYSGWGVIDHDPGLRRCPPYFNHGVMAGTRDVMAAVGEVVMAELAAVEKAIETRFRSQLAVTAALERKGIPWRLLPLRFNFPNDERFRAVYPEEAAAVRILHYLRTDDVDRENIATSLPALQRFLARTDLSGMNKLLQERVRDLREDLESELSLTD